MRSIFLAGTALLVAAPAAAQSDLPARVGKLESEMRAVQRKVFPGGAGALVEPQIAAPTIAAEPAGTPASSAVADLTARVSSLEDQLRTMTGQIEQNQYRVRQLEEQFAAFRKAADAAAAAAPPPAAVPATGGPAADEAEPPRRPAAARPAATRPAPAAASDDPDRADKVAAVAKPSTGNAAKDGYDYGYRLWQAKLYPEAQAQLKSTVAAHPKDKWASYAQNLLGRAYLDDGKPSLASIAFYQNYKTLPEGDRAPDSLTWLGTSLIRLNKLADACKVYGELDDIYGAKLSPSLRAQADKGKASAKCK